MGQPLCKRRTRAAAFLGRGVEHHHVLTCVQEVAKVMTTSTDQHIRLEQPKLELGLCIQPGNRGCPHGPCVDVKTHKEHQLGRAAEGFVGGDHLNPVCSRRLMRNIGGRTDVFEDVDERWPFVWEPKRQ